ncbi:MAG: DNA methyltransferase [Bacilli bacterium]|jgi:site-specific DNA-methyltransferase (adenine-specific)
MSKEKNETMDLFNFNKPVIKGYPELRWTGKRPYTSTQFFPAQLKEKYGEADESEWLNKIFWGDNLQVMSHLLRDYRGMIDLIYIDPPFDSKANYKKKIELKGKKSIYNDQNMFEEKQYGDIWTNDEYLQFMYERLILLRELLSDKGSIYLHCDWHKVHHLRMLMDEVFGPDKFVNEIIWSYRTASGAKGEFNKQHDNILFYSKTADRNFNEQKEKSYTKAKGRKAGVVNYGAADTEFFEDESGVYRWSGMRDVWDIPYINSQALERLGYPTQKPEALIERIIDASSNEGDIVFDCFMGSGTTQAVALKKNRRFIGADINLGAVQISTKRIISILEDNNLFISMKTGFEVYNVNNYDFFRNPIEARELLIEALEIQAFSESHVFDGELDGRHVKILPVNRIATKADLEPLINNLPYKMYEKLADENPNEPVDRITLVCMGHESDLKGAFLQAVGNSKFKIDVEIVDILRDKSDLEFKRDAQAEIEVKGDKLTIKEFYPMNLLQKLSLQKELVDDWKQLVDSIMIDYEYDGFILNPQIIDIPEKNKLVDGSYKIPSKHGRIKIKITDLLSESLEIEVE